MPLDEYKKRGRSEMLRTVTQGEILKLTSALMRESVDGLSEGLEDHEAEVEQDAPR